ncbi:tRNA uridine-5-carboxymethylaminomethyl(34) synthesis enzyme MnmG [Haliovirga abyssi]|uniref:tRNA uridine 5-carboxymethylaminomethyl modification enzyme MnmG n=1 Tax=Haliovirga abyssi TaxID=2996794 RepID=A0AAU9DKN9_9FUSO|nr:tRNA uridine-5-carboxymethylaminomethyl(34) synthesis enzyme MnmG [Haliovirga abyssi]BDU51494.1 tRNA uridine 5-carboxymethylaminomethyl modification enzyme MnmG 1 [Haliovirga abyssi]
MINSYDIIVIGAGHAGVEAALAAARLGKKTAIFTIYLDSISMMSCNPAIGGPGKSHLISEVDILGGEIGKHTDKYNIQLKYLNSTKGVAARVTRAQADKYWYRVKMKEVLENTENLEVIQEVIDEILVKNGKIVGVKSSLGIEYKSKAVVLATGTFLKGRVVIGDIKYNSGRQGEQSSEKLSDSLIKNGIKIERFQTATPPRIDKRTIDFEKVTELKGEDNPVYFSIFTKKEHNLNIPTWLTYTTKETIKVTNELLKFSPIVTGMIDTKGPRHCPSIDRKVLNFPEKENHQVFLEQESVETNEIYVNGMTTSMPPFAQEKMLKTLPGLENVKIMRYGYGIEYDYIPPFQLYPNYENKIVKNLFLAGQINGTSGYEEAAAQGFMAGVNAVRKIENKEPIIIRRDEGYIGVLTDDLINKELLEPYRVLPSRAEYRLILRQDNSFIRMLEKSKEIGILKKEQIEHFEELKEAINVEINRLKNLKVYPGLENNLVLEGMGEKPIKKAITAAELLKRNRFSYNDLKYFVDIREYPKKVIEQVEIEIKYEDFIEREEKQIKRFKKLENVKIPKNFNYSNVNGLSNIAVDALNKTKPFSVGQASRISGVSPGDIAIILSHIK